MLALVVRLAAPSAFTLVLSLSLLTAIVIGGLGSLLGALLGSALLVFLPPFVTDLGSDFGLNQTERRPAGAVRLRRGADRGHDLRPGRASSARSGCGG